LLADLSEEERRRILEQKGLPRLTEKTITDKKELENELSRVKKQGFVLDREENEEDFHCIAAPIENYQGKVIAAISISSPMYCLDINNQNYLKEAFKKISKKISKKLGDDEKI
jgi:DNA-binding IclR family transcriptional regulator